MPIKVSTPTSVTAYLDIADPEGKTWVKIRPPDYHASAARDEIRKRYRLTGAGVEVDINMHDLWAMEIWLTYEDTNLEVEFVGPDGEVTDRVKFEPRDKMTQAEFLNRLGKLPPGIVYEWHQKVLEVVQDWGYPF